MRRVRYGVGASLDAFIADPADGLGWMTSEPAYDQRPFFASVDTALMGRRTYEAMVQHGARSVPGMRSYVVSRTLRPEDYPEVTVVADDVAATVAALRAEGGKDIWLAGGGVLLASLLAEGLVDTIEVGVNPVLLGGGVPLLASLPHPVRLRLTHTEPFPSGLLVLHYDVRHDPA